MEPSSLAMPEALRPATISAVSTGPSSRTRVIETSVPVLPTCPYCARARDICSAMTAPLKNPVSTTIGQAADADRVHLQDDVVAVVGRAEDVPEGPAGEEEEILNRENRLFQKIEQEGWSPNFDATIEP